MGKENHRLTFPTIQNPWLYSIWRHCQGVSQRQQQKPGVGPHFIAVFCLLLDDTELVFSMSSSWICKHHAWKLHVNMHGFCCILFLWILQSFQSVWWSPPHAWHRNPTCALHLSTFQGHFCQYWCPCNQNDCSTKLVPQLMDQAFAALDLKRKNRSASWTFGSWIDAAAVHSIRSGVRSREWNSLLSRILRKRFSYPLTTVKIQRRHRDRISVFHFSPWNGDHSSLFWWHFIVATCFPVFHTNAECCYTLFPSWSLS